MKLIKDCPYREEVEESTAIMHDCDVVMSNHVCTGTARHYCPYDGRLPAKSCPDCKGVDAE